MNSGTATLKVIGGKLIRVDVIFEDKLESVKLTGDFFLHPEDILEEIVKIMEGVKIPFKRDELEQNIGNVLIKNNAQLIGASAADIVTCLEEAISCNSV